MKSVYTPSMLRKRKTIQSPAKDKKPSRQNDPNIMIFSEEISNDRKQTNSANSGSLNAHELFNIFTAEIIKIKVSFTR